jgi:hypothetical protein
MTTKSNWTVLVYMVADTGDSFYQDAMKNMGEMMSAQFDERVRVVVHADAPSPWRKRCWEVTGAPKCAESDDTRTKIGTAKEKKDWRNNSVLDFVQRVIDDPNYTSDYYLLVLWGHGEGIDWKQKVLAGPPSAKIEGADKRFAPGSQGALEVGELGKALAKLDDHFKRFGEKRNQKVVVGFDACLMGMVEVYYEIQPYVGWAVAANDEIPTTGWPYKDILNLIGKDPTIEPGKLAESIVKICSNWYSQNSPETKVSFAACNLLKSGTLMEATKMLAAELKKCIQEMPVYRAVSEARDLAEDLVESAYIDLYGFCKELEQRTEQKQLKGAAHAVVEQVTGGSVTQHSGFVTEHSFSDAYPYPFVENTRAMSICFPESSNLEGSVKGIQVNWESYTDLTFSHATNWPSFLTEFWKKQRATGDRRKALAAAG